MFRKRGLGAEQRGSGLVEMALGSVLRVLFLAGVAGLGRVFCCISGGKYDRKTNTLD